MRSNRLVSSLSLLFLAASSAWANTNLEVSNVGPISGTYSLKVNFDGGTGNAYVIDTSPADETSYHLSFRVKQGQGGTYNMALSTNHILFQARETTPSTTPSPFRLTIARFPDGRINCRAWAWETGLGDFTLVGGMILGNNANVRVDVEWHQETAGNNGVLKLWKNRTALGDSPIAQSSALDNETINIDEVWFGAPRFVDATTSGFYLLDEFVSTRTPQF